MAQNGLLPYLNIILNNFRSNKCLCIIFCLHVFCVLV
jgi:hypothetical protein